LRLIEEGRFVQRIARAYVSTAAGTVDYSPEKLDSTSFQMRLAFVHSNQGDEMTTGKKDATMASKILRNPKSSKAAKSVAASDLAQAKPKPKK
jgi:hypothetical protein